MDDGRTTDGRTDGHRLDGYTISSPCEPNGAGELTRATEKLKRRKPVDLALKASLLE